MPKVYKTKNNKLAVYVPYDVIEALGIKDGDDLDFLKYGESTYLLAKKMDIVKLLAKANTAEEPKESKPSTGKAAYAPRIVSGSTLSLEPQELSLLKKLDTLKYNDRTSTKVSGMLSSDEKATLQTLIKRGIVVPFKKSTEKEIKYSIQKNVYDQFPYRNKPKEAQPIVNTVQKAKSTQTVTQQPVRQKAWEQRIASSGAEAYIEMLESKGFLVLNSEPDAALVSAALEDSIRQGLILGTRAFNKKFT